MKRDCYNEFEYWIMKKKIAIKNSMKIHEYKYCWTKK